MAFPQTPLDVLVEMMLAGTWTDVTDWVYLRDRIQMAHGRADEAARPDPAKCTLTLDNRDGRFCIRNPMSPLYGLIGRNTPLRVSVPDTISRLELDESRTGSASTPHATALNITGDIDVRVELDIDPTEASGQNQMIIGKWGVTDPARAWMLRLVAGQFTIRWLDSGGIGHEAAVNVSHYGGRALRATVDVNNGASGFDVSFYQADSMDGPWQLMLTTTGAGANSIQSTTSPLAIGITDPDFIPPRRPMVGTVTRAQVRSGINGTIVANPDFRPQAAGTTSFADSAGRTWTVNSPARIIRRDYRFHGEISEWPTKWDVSGKDIYTTVTAQDPNRRLGAGSDNLQSTLRRRIPAYSPLAYWPLEEGSTATQAGSPIAGVAPLRTTGFNYAQNDSLVSSAPLPALSSTNGLPTMRGVVPAPTAPISGWRVAWVYRLDTPNTTLRTFMQITTTGTAATWTLQWRNNLTRVIALDSEGNTLFTNDFATGTDLYSQWVEARFYVSQSGGTVNWTMEWQDVGGDAGKGTSSFSGTIGRVTTVNNPGSGFSPDLDGMAIGHIAVFGTSTTDAYSNAITGWAGESAAARMLRLGTEEVVPLSAIGVPDQEEKVGAQRMATFLDALGSAGDADGGILYGRRDRLALRYRDRASLYNQTPALVLNYTTPGHVAPDLAPTDDDKDIENDVTVQRQDGATGYAQQLEGPNSVLPPGQGGIGRKPNSYTLNLYDDDQPAQHAGWRVHLGTWDGARWPSVAVDLAAAVSLIPTAQAVELGDRIQITNAPPYAETGTIDLIVQGYTEVIGEFDWDLVFNCTPAGPWDVATTNDPKARADTSGSALTASATSTAATLKVITAPGKREWFGGGQVLNPNPGPFGAVTGWSGSGGTLSLVDVPSPAPTVSEQALQLIPDGVATFPNIASSVVAATVGTVYRVSGWIRCAQARSVDLNINWFTSGGAYISTSTAQNQSLTANTWTWFEGTVTAPATTGQMTVNPTAGSTPPSAAVLYAQQVTIRAAADTAALVPQEFPWDVTVAGEVVRVHSVADTNDVSDSFNRANSTTSMGTADSGQAWAPITNTWGIQTNRAYAINTANSITSIQAASDLRDLRVTAAVWTTGEVYLLLRMSSAADRIRVGCAFGSRLQLQVISGNSVVRTVVSAFTPVQGDTISVSAQGPFIHCYINGVRALTVYEETNQLLTLVGLQTANNTVRFEDFSARWTQTMTVTRSINGVVKSLSAAADLRLTHPAHAAL
ncbi:hypothetical protein ABZZ36_18420 [Actinacidiphila glaucinigra]|uniref:hypothetical protein n=1 Tax=Actinacidiphila glaucinigra TaxID=235986 RepID=UPI0033B8827A